MNRVVSGRLLLSVLTLTTAGPPALAAQDTGFERRPARWTVEFGTGVRIPTTLYNETIIRKQGSDSILRTRWEETTGPGWETRLGVRLNPENGVGLFVAGFVGGANTTAAFSGGISPPEQISRSVKYTGIDVGVSVRLKSWAEGRGIIDYHVGGVVQRSVIDLSPGHRDALTYFGGGNGPPEVDWDSRTSTSWGLNLGASVRTPINDRWTFRTTFKDMIIPTNTTSLARQEAQDIQDISGRRVQVTMNRFTSHNLSLTVGVEYTVGWGRSQRDVIRRAPLEGASAEVDPAVTNAMRLAAEGDTAAAIAALEHRVSVEPRDGYAWRELALLRASRGEYDPTVRAEALATLERALNQNPGDTELLRAYGRLRGLTERGGQTPEAEAVSPLEASALSVSATAAGDVRAAMAARGLRAATDGQYRFEVSVEVFTADGTSVPIRPGLSPLHEGEGNALLMLSAADQLPLSVSVDFALAEPNPGFYTVRLWLTDLETGARHESTAGFEIL